MSWDMSRVVGHNAKVRRLEMGMDVASFGARMEEILDKPWKRQTVSAMENGDRAMTANDLVAIAHVLERTPAMLLVPPVEADDIRVGKLKLEPRVLMSTASLANESLGLLIDLMDEVREVWGAIGRATRTLDAEATKRLEAMDDKITAYVAGYGKEESDG